MSNMVKCQNCNSLIDYGAEPEVSMGAIKCPVCKATINQDGEVLSIVNRVYNAKKS